MTKSALWATYCLNILIFKKSRKPNRISGSNSAPNCVVPQITGKKCQFTCTCKGAETCHPSFGCILPTTTKTTTTTSVKTTTEGMYYMHQCDSYTPVSIKHQR